MPAPRSVEGERRMRIWPGRMVICTAVAILGIGAGCHTMSWDTKGELSTELARLESPAVQAILSAPETYRVQVLISEVVPGRGGRPTLRRHGYRLDAEYFYPASSIKLCAAVAALQWVQATVPDPERLLDAPFEIAPLFPGDPEQRWDPVNPERPELGVVALTLRREIRKLALVSDNRAFNRLFDVLGHEALNRAMHELGHGSVVLNHRLSETRPIPRPLASAAVRWPGQGPGGTDLRVPARESERRLENHSAGLRIGEAYLRGDERVPEPMDFARRNGISLVDLQNLLVQVVRPDVDVGLRPLGLAPALRAMLVEAMRQYPRESMDPPYDAVAYPDHFAKPLLPGVRRVVSSTEPGERVEITGKIGRAYGFSVENSYLAHPATGRALFVTAVLYTNADGVLNDDRYEYETVADPVLADLGEWVTRRWLLEGAVSAARMP